MNRIQSLLNYKLAYGRTKQKKFEFMTSKEHSNIQKTCFEND
jgi:hypothetical protein